MELRIGKRIVLIDEDDLPLVRNFHWHLQEARPGVFYVRAQRKPHNIRPKMHRLIVGAKPDQWVGHKNGNTLDNRRENLRLCTPSQNSSNRAAFPKSSKFKGVYLRKKTGGVPYRTRPWGASIATGGRSRRIGNFADEVSAALAYDAAARELFGEFARCNFPNGMPPILNRSGADAV